MEAGGLRLNDEGLMESDIPLGRPHYDLPTLNLDLMEESETEINTTTCRMRLSQRPLRLLACTSPRRC